MRSSTEYHIAKAKSFIQNTKEGLSNLDLSVRLGMGIHTYDKFKSYLKDVPEIYWNASTKKWVWSG